MLDVVEQQGIGILKSEIHFYEYMSPYFSMDYINLRKDIPNSCRHPVSGNRFGYNCPQVLAWWLEPWTGTLASISLGFCVLDFFVIAATMKLRSYIRKSRETK